MMSCWLRWLLLAVDDNIMPPGGHQAVSDDLLAGRLLAEREPPLRLCVLRPVIPPYAALLALLLADESSCSAPRLRSAASSSSSRRIYAVSAQRPIRSIHVLHPRERRLQEFLTDAVRRVLVDVGTGGEHAVGAGEHRARGLGGCGGVVQRRRSDLVPARWMIPDSTEPLEHICRTFLAWCGLRKIESVRAC